MKNLLLTLLMALAFAGTAFSQCQSGGNGNGNGNGNSNAGGNGNGNGNAAQAQAQAPVSLQKALAAIREARIALNSQLGQAYSISFYYGRYYAGSLTVEYMGVTEGKEWYRVSYGGGSVILGIDDEI